MPRRSKSDGAANSIARWRLHRGHTQEQLAHLTGMTTASISRIENGKQPYTQRTLEAIAARLGCDVSDLLVSHLTPEQIELRDILRGMSPQEASRAIRVLRALKDSGK